MLKDRNFCFTAKDFFNELSNNYPEKTNELLTEKIALIVFPESTLNYLKKNASLEKRNWLMDVYSLYASPTEIWTGKCNNCIFNVVKPPMGDSAVAAVIEQLIICGTEAIFLVCGAWGLQKNQLIGDILVPTISKAQNNIAQSYHTSNKLEINEEVLELIQKNAKKLELQYFTGSNVAFESFYRIPKRRLEKERKKGSNSAENGELHTLLSIAKNFQIEAGAILYNYFQPLADKHLETSSEPYSQGGINIAKIALNTIVELKL